MATDIPLFVSQIFADSTFTVTVDNAQSLATTRWYYYVSNRSTGSTTSNGQSLLTALEEALRSATTGGPVWTLRLSSTNYRLQISHAHASSQSITFGGTLGTALGFASSPVVVAASTTVTADYPSIWQWSPGMPISGTGPQPWDPAVSYGVPHAVGNAQRAPDQTAAYVSNGVLYDAEIMFNGVENYYTIRPQSGHTNKDLETWWTNGPRKGRRVLMWRDRADATGSDAPSEGSATPYNYVQYYPAPELQMNFPAVPTAPPNLYYHDVKLSLWLTEDGETPLTD
ncbi:MAG TPA: hypothetical protein VD931_13665 [Baekduia sp.]|nr:hypothetical protein [Baekduia sp.]